jgi:hypothetical protein
MGWALITEHSHHAGSSTHRHVYSNFDRGGAGHCPRCFSFQIVVLASIVRYLHL